MICVFVRLASSCFQCISNCIFHIRISLVSMEHQLVPIGMVQDIFGVDYQLVLMPTNGLCGFSCFAYSVTGNIDAYADVLDDCFNLFHHNPQLYIQQTEFGRKQPNLSHYCSSLKHAVANISTHSVVRRCTSHWLRNALRHRSFRIQLL